MPEFKRTSSNLILQLRGESISGERNAVRRLAPVVMVFFLHGVDSSFFGENMDWGITLGIIGIVVGVVALAVAVPPLIALLWGQPQIVAKFIQTQYGIACQILNVPIRSKFLQVLGVIRREPEVYVGLLIKDGDGKVIAGPMNAIDQFDHQPGCTILLGVHECPQFSVAGWRSADAQKPEISGDAPDGRRKWAIIQEGHYVATVTTRDIAANRTFEFCRRFVVGPNPMETKWLPD